MKSVQLWRRMLGRLEIQPGNFGVLGRLGRRKHIGYNHHRRMERHVSDRQDAWRLRRNHALAAIVTLIGRIAGHGTATLHTLLVLRRRRHAVCKLQT